MGGEEVEMLSIVDAPRSLGLKGRRERIVSEGGVWRQWGLRMGRVLYNKRLFQSQLCIPRIFTSIILFLSRFQVFTF